MDISVTRNDAAHRYELTVGGVRAGICQFHDGEGIRAFTHTEIKDEFEGQGLGSVIARAVLEDTVNSGLRVVPYCPFIAAWLRKHHDYDQYIDWPPKS